jgi:CelD/BcsL family acetyltransferase involved in cellulose biosynthesis
MSEFFGLLREPPESAWDSLVADANGGTAFHTSAWARVWEDEWRGAQWQAVVLEKDDRIVAGLGFIVRPGPLGRRIFSMPDGTYGGPLVSSSIPAATAAAIRGRLIDHYQRLGGVLVSHLRWLPSGAAPAGSQPGVEHGGLPRGLEEDFTHIVSLRSDYDALLARLSHGVRSRVKQAEESGLTMRPITDAEGVRAYHDLVVLNARRHRARPRPLSLYLRVWERLVPRGLARFDLVLHEGVAIGGSLHLLYGRSAMNWLTVADEEMRALRPNHFVLSHWLRELGAAGYGEYDLGSSPPSAPGLIDFKESWGAERRPVITLWRRSLLYRLLRP